jgi:hypothetical protein
MQYCFCVVLETRFVQILFLGTDDDETNRLNESLTPEGRDLRISDVDIELVLVTSSSSSPPPDLPNILVAVRVLDVTSLCVLVRDVPFIIYDDVILSSTFM